MTSRESPYWKREQQGQQSLAEMLFFEPAMLQETNKATGLTSSPSDLYSSLLPLYRVALVRDGALAMDTRPQIHNPESVANILWQYLQDKDREYFCMLMLDTKNRVIGMHVVSIGILDSALVSPREVFKMALLSNAASVILGHNHPSGDPTPSAEDKRITQQLSEAGKLMHIEVLDHIIVGAENRFTSLKERGFMD